MIKKLLDKILGVGITSLMFFSVVPVSVNAEWLSSNGKWWYSEGNSYATGWRELKNEDDESNWYYFEDDGCMKIGWLKYGDKWYYLDNNGTMATGWKTIDDKTYYFDEDGVMQSYRTKLIDDKLYYFLENGEMATGWHNIYGNCWIYANSNGDLVMDKTIDGYYVNKNGEWYSA